MSADSQLITIPGFYSVCLPASLPDTQQQMMGKLLNLLSAAPIVDSELDSTTSSQHPTLTIKSLVDGRGLACPMPLLKTKVALREVAAGESLYVVATDPNSQADITAFCRQSQKADTANKLSLTVNNVTNQQLTDSKSSQHFDTIYHFIITKTDSN